MKTLAAVIVAALAVAAQPNSYPNPYRTIEHWYTMPEGRTMGSTSAVWVAPSGHIWVAERCGANSCSNSDLASVLEFDTSGKLLSSFGAKMFAFPHGIWIEKDGTIWLTDGQDSSGKSRQQVFKLTPGGKVLMTLGKEGVAGDGPDTFNQPNAVAIAPNADIFVSDGHNPGRGNARVLKFSKDGKPIKQWGGHGSGPGQFEVPHCLAFDSKGRLFVCDRANNRIQIFDQDGKFLEEWKQFGRPSGIFIDSNDTIYVADHQSDKKQNPGFKRGIRIGSLKDGKVTAFIPGLGADPETQSVGEGVVADAGGNVWWAETSGMAVRKFVLR